MAFLSETDVWESVYQLETTDPVEGGVAGKDNVAPRQLANRTLYLKNLVDALGTGKQPLDATLTALAALVTAADKFIYATGVDTFSTATLTAFARALLDDADAATMRGTLGLGDAAPRNVGSAAGTVAAGDHGHASYQPTDATLTALAALTTAADKLIYATGADTFSTATITAFARALLDDTDAATMRATLGLGTAATTASTAYQPTAATLTAIAALVTAADKLIYATGADTFSTTTLTAFARTLLDDADAATMRATLAIVAASQTTAGLIEIATNAEVAAGTDAVRAVTPDGLDSVFTRSLAPSGYQKLPGGLILQWGRTPALAYAVSTAISYPIAFPNAVLKGDVESETPPSAPSGNTFFAYTSLSQFTTSNPDSGAARVYRWMAIGY